MAALPTRNDKFFALSRVCRASKKNKTRPSKLGRGMLTAIHGRIGCSGCTSAEPYPPNRAKSLAQRKTKTKLENPILKH